MTLQGKLWIGALLLVLCWFSWLLLAPARIPHDVLGKAKLYCQQVHAGNWPDFQHVYQKQCNKDGSVNQAYVAGESQP